MEAPRTGACSTHLPSARLQSAPAGAAEPKSGPLTPRSHRLCFPPGSSLAASARSGPAARGGPLAAHLEAAPGYPVCIHPPVGFSSVVTVPPPLPLRTLTGDYLGPIQIRQDNFPMLGDLHSFQGLRPEFFWGVLEQHCSVYHRHSFPSDHEYSCSLRYL